MRNWRQAICSTRGRGNDILLRRVIIIGIDAVNECAVDVFARFALNVWGVDPQLDCWTAAQKGIEKLAEFFASMGLPMTLREVGIDESRLEEMAEKAAETDFSRAFVPLTREDILQIYRACL